MPLSVDLAHWPGIVIAVVDGTIVASNGCLEKALGRAVVGEGVTAVLDLESSARKWERIISMPSDAARTWELILRGTTSLPEPRTFSVARDVGERGAARTWLVEHPRDRRRDAADSEMAAVNSELGVAQRELVKERARLASARDALTRSNAALDEFAHAVSHDLKAPLRAILEYAELIERDAGPVLSEELRGYLERVTVLSHKMRRMIDAVLEYARVGRVTSVRERADSGEVLREVVEFLAPPDDVTIELAPDLPTFDMERVPFEQVFRNLLANAVKYRRASGARVAVSAVDEADSWRFEVADNGPGISPGQQSRIWGLFQTSDPRESTGIGLALVKRIAEAQGGRVSVESTPGEGACFAVTWPKRPRLNETYP